MWNHISARLRGHEVSSSDSAAVRQQKLQVAQKLSMVKQAIIDVLRESTAGISLAQLPLHLKYRLPFPLDLNELGFVKLKELLVTMPGQVQIEVRGHNHSFVRLVHASLSRPFGSADLDAAAGPGPFVDFNRQLELVRGCLYSMLLESPAGVDSAKLPLLLYMRLGIKLDWFVFGCGTLLEFLQKYVSPYYELEFVTINPYDSTQFVLRLKEAYRNYVNAAQSPYPVHYRFETDPNVLATSTLRPQLAPRWPRPTPDPDKETSRSHSGSQDQRNWSESLSNIAPAAADRANPQRHRRRGRHRLVLPRKVGAGISLPLQGLQRGHQACPCRLHLAAFLPSILLSPGGGEGG